MAAEMTPLGHHNSGSPAASADLLHNHVVRYFNCKIAYKEHPSADAINGIAPG